MEALKSAIAGSFARSWIQRQLGKDWYRSWTVWGLVIYETADTAVNTACDAGVIEASLCASAIGALQSAGKILVVLGIRRKRN